MAYGGDDDDAPAPTPTTVESRTTGTERPTGTPTADPNPTLGPEYVAAIAMEHARVLAEDIGPRPAGSQAELVAAEYIRARLNEYGYEAELQPFPITTYLVVRSEAKAEHGEGALTVESTPLSRSGSGLVTAPLVEAGLGYPEDFPSTTAGSIVLLERGELTFTEKAANAREAGAIGVLVFNNQGGPFGGTLRDQVPMPVVSISREDGGALQDLLASEDVTMTLDVELQVNESSSNNVIGRPPGGGCRIVAGGHYDSVETGPGANDNASGTGVVLEIARGLAADGEFDEVCFALFGAEEIGLVGSSHYVTSNSLAGVEAMLNFDMLAVGEGWPLGGTTELVDLTGEVAESLGISYRLDSTPGTGGSDHAPFIDAGVPALIFNCFCDPNYHTAADRFEFLSEQRMVEAGALGLGVIGRLLGE
ncbi:MAG TPA: M28 family metallopeptidase [Dehalococcoidia bacterium]|nr:M28 family metallopeptidase [Dehalococcoidia bacterium]